MWVLFYLNTATTQLITGNASWPVTGEEIHAIIFNSMTMKKEKKRKKKKRERERERERSKKRQKFNFLFVKKNQI